MISDISKILKRIGLPDNGHYENHFYIITLKDSDEYSKVYSKLDKAAINKEFPDIGVNTSNNTEKITHYFEIDEDNDTYYIFLFADFKADEYYIKIRESL